MKVRCGKCAACKRVDEEGRLYRARLARSVTPVRNGRVDAVLVPGTATEADRQHWNQLLNVNPCEQWAQSGRDSERSG